MQQEQRSLINTGDGFKKIIITKDALAPLYNEAGVLVMNVFDFLLKPDSMEIFEILDQWRKCRMFRGMRRFKQQISIEECVQILKEQPRGVLSVLGDEDYPYGIPLNHWYCEENGKLYFHCAKTGHKLDAVRKHDKVSYCVYDQGFRKEGDWALNIRSVVLFCRARIVDDSENELKQKIAVGLCRKFTDDEDFLQNELTNAMPRAAFLELTPEHMTGKLVNES